jgi:hypothetical protein
MNNVILSCATIPFCYVKQITRDTQKQQSFTNILLRFIWIVNTLNPLPQNVFNINYMTVYISNTND